MWNAIPVKDAEVFDWDPDSTYIQEPPFFIDSAWRSHHSRSPRRVLILLGDSVTTDHISPAGSIALNSPAALPDGTWRGAA